MSRGANINLISQGEGTVGEIKILILRQSLRVKNRVAGRHREIPERAIG